MRLLVLLLLVPLPACTSFQKERYGNAENYSHVPADHGVVVFQVIVNEARIGEFTPEWREANATTARTGPALKVPVPENSKGQANVVVDFEADVGIAPGSSTFVGILPAGTYTKANISSYTSVPTYGGRKYETLSLPLPDGYSTFDVVSGKATVLGTFVSQPLPRKSADPNVSSLLPYGGYSQHKSTRPFLMLSVEPDGNILRAAADHHPQIQGVEVAESVGLGHVVSQVEVKSGLGAVAFPSGAPYRLQRDELVLPAKLGALYRRNVDGSWHVEQVPTLQQIVAVNESQDGLFVVDALGNAFHQSTEDGAFSPLDYDSPEGKLLAIGRDSQGKLIAITRTVRPDTSTSIEKKEKATVPCNAVIRILSREIDTGAWSTNSSIRSDTCGPARAEVGGDMAYVLIPRSRFFGVDLLTGQQHSAEVDFTHFRLSDGVRIVGFIDDVEYDWFYESWLVFNNPTVAISYDAGKEWVPFRKHMQPSGWPDVDSEWIYLPGRRIYASAGEKEMPTGLFRKKRDWDGWAKVADYPSFCRYQIAENNENRKNIRLVVLKKEIIMICDDKVYSLTHDAEVWRQEVIYK